jgi:hypothetical protein
MTEKQAYEEPILLRKRTTEERIDYLTFQVSFMRVELDNALKSIDQLLDKALKDIDQLQKKTGLKETPKPFKKKPPKGQKSL